MTRHEQYERDGFIPCIDVLTAEETAQLRVDFDALEADLGKEASQIGIVAREHEVEFLWRLATHPKILDAVVSVYGEDLLMIGTHVFCKYSAEAVGKAAYVAWHQDVTYWGLRPPKAISVWLAIDDVDEENGAMLVIPCTHTQACEHGKSDDDENLLSVNQAIDDGALDVDTAVPIILKAGQLSLHDGLLVHGSRPNHSGRRRAGLTIRFTTPDVVPVPDSNKRVHWQSVLVRGEDRYGNWPLKSAPVFN